MTNGGFRRRIDSLKVQRPEVWSECHGQSQGVGGQDSAPAGAPGALCPGSAPAGARGPCVPVALLRGPRGPCILVALLRGPGGPCVPVVLLRGPRGPCILDALMQGPWVPASQQRFCRGLGDPVSWQRSCRGPGALVSWTVLLRRPRGPCILDALMQGPGDPCVPAALLQGPGGPCILDSAPAGARGPCVPAALLRGPRGPCVFESSADRAAPAPGPVGPLLPLTPASSRARSVATLVPPRSGAVLTHPEASLPRPPPCCLPGPLALGASVRLSVPDAGTPSWCGFSRAPARSLAVSHLPAVGPQVVSSQRKALCPSQGLCSVAKSSQHGSHCSVSVGDQAPPASLPRGVLPLERVR